MARSQAIRKGARAPSQLSQVGYFVMIVTGKEEIAHEGDSDRVGWWF